MCRHVRLVGACLHTCLRLAGKRTCAIVPRNCDCTDAYCWAGRCGTSGESAAADARATNAWQTAAALRKNVAANSCRHPTCHLACTLRDCVSTRRGWARLTCAQMARMPQQYGRIGQGTVRRKVVTCKARRHTWAISVRRQRAWALSLRASSRRLRSLQTSTIRGGTAKLLSTRCSLRLSMLRHGPLDTEARTVLS